MNHEINSWLRNQPDVYATTVGLQLRVSALGKLLTHSSALYCPTTCAMPPSLALTKRCTAIVASMTSQLSGPVWGNAVIKRALF